MYHNTAYLPAMPAHISFRERSPYQKITLGRIDNRRFLMLGEREIQYVEGREEAAYHLTLGPRALQWLRPMQNVVAIIGGGDGILARRLLEARPELDITIFELDPAMIRTFKTHPEALEMNRGALSMVRQIVYGDAFKTLPKYGGTFDAIFVDLPDLSRSTAYLYSPEMLRRIYAKLKPMGVVSMFTGSGRIPEAFEDFFELLECVPVPGFVAGSGVICAGRKRRVVQRYSMLPAGPLRLAESPARQAWYAAPDAGTLLPEPITLGDPGFFKSVGSFFTKTIPQAVKTIAPIALPIAAAAFLGPAAGVLFGGVAGRIMGGGGGAQGVGYYAAPEPEMIGLPPPGFTVATGIPVTPELIQEVQPQQRGIDMSWFQPGGGVPISAAGMPGFPEMLPAAEGPWYTSPFVIASIIGAVTLIVVTTMTPGGRPAPRHRAPARRRRR